MLTTHDLTATVLPYVRNAVNLAKQDVKAELKRWEWALVYPAWAVITGPLLPILTRITIEISFALTRAKGLPVVNGLAGFAEQLDASYLTQKAKDAVKDFRDLYATPPDQLHPAVLATINGEHCGGAECLAGVS